MKTAAPGAAAVKGFRLTRARAAYVALAFAFAAILSVLLNLTVPPLTFKRDLTVVEQVPEGLYRDDGLVDPPGIAYGLYDPETSSDGTVHRWTTDRAAITFPYIGNIARHVEVNLNIAALRDASQAPAEVAIRLNGKVVSDFIADNNHKVYTFQLDTQTLPNPYLYPSDVTVDIKSATVDAGNDEQRGVDLQWIAIHLQRGFSDVLIESLVWGLCLAFVTLIASARLSPRWSLIYAVATICTLALVHLTYVPRAISPTVETALAGLAWTWAAALAPRRWPMMGMSIAGALAAAGLWVVIGGRMLVDWEVDDAYISYRYAWNFVHGSGLIYNPGQPPVEGYTNFLWTVFAAGGIWLGLPPDGLALTATIACGICLLGLTYYLGARLAGTNPAWPLLAVGLLALSACFITYGPKGSGLEAVPFGVTVLVPIALLWGRDASKRVMWWRVAGGFALAIAALTRPEGIMAAALFLTVRAWQDRCARSTNTPTIRLLLAALLPFLLIVVPYQIWRVTFYGYPFPNTFYAKTGTSFEEVVRGADYTWNFFLNHWLLALLGMAGVAATAVQALKSSRRTTSVGTASQDEAANMRSALAVLVTVYTLYIIVEGGDWANANRFFVPIAAPLALLAQEGVRTGLAWIGVARGKGLLLARLVLAALLVAATVYNMQFELPSNKLGLLFLTALVVAYGVYVVLLRQPERRFAVAALVALLAVYGIYNLWLQRPDGYLAIRTMRDTYKYQKWDLAALWIRDHTPPQTVLAVIPAGGIAYYSQRPVIDMLGLNDLHIGHLNVKDMGRGVAGHEKRDPVYVFGKKPDYLLAFDSWYFEPMREQFDTTYDTVSIRTASGYEILMLKRKGLP